MSKYNEFLVELIKAERDKCLIETIKECDLNSNQPIKTTDKLIRLTNEEIEKIFDRVNASNEEREIWRNIYFKQEKINESN